MNKKFNDNIRNIILASVMVIVSSCAITNKDITRQDIVSKREIQLMSYFREGMYYFKNNKYLESVQSFERALAISDNLKTRYNLALALERLGDTERALAIMTELYYNHPEDINFKMAAARMLDLMGRKDEAISVYNEVLDRLKGKVEVKDYKYKVYRRLADLYYKIGELQEAGCYSHMAYNENITKDELLRHLRLMLAINVPIKDIYAFAKIESKKIGMQNDEEAQGDDSYSRFNENIGDVNIDSENQNVEDCRLESIYAWAFINNFKDNEKVLSEVIARSKECLDNKDSFRLVLMILENIATYNSNILHGQEIKDDDENNMSYSDDVILSLPGSAYKHLAEVSPIFNIVRN